MSDGWTSGVIGSAGVSTGGPETLRPATSAIRNAADERGRHEWRTWHEWGTWGDWRQWTSYQWSDWTASEWTSGSWGGTDEPSAEQRRLENLAKWERDTGIRRQRLATKLNLPPGHGLTKERRWAILSLGLEPPRLRSAQGSGSANQDPLGPQRWIAKETKDARAHVAIATVESDE